MRNLRRHLIPLLFAAVSGCAASSVDHPPAMPAARVALQPEFRLFYDALVDYGDWVLIEPYGYVFRPRVDYLTWRPYTNGYWAPSDVYGWVWVSAETFGWATEHYGRWLWDDYQGWVWVPGVDWGPAWVTWQMGGPWVGWAPLSPFGDAVSGSRLPNGSYVFAPVQNLGSSNVSTSLVSRDALGSAAATISAVRNPVERNGVRFDLGPSISQIERLQARSIPRARLEDVLPPPGAPVRTAGAGGAAPADSIVLPSPATVKSAGDDAARQTRQITEAEASAPARVPVIRPFAGGRAAPAASPPSGGHTPRPRATADSSRGDHR
jgi:hypothetical protein